MFNFNNSFLNCTVNINQDKKININGTITNPSLFNDMLILAPNPPNNLSSYSGSFLPFPCEEIAYENTPNVYNIPKSGIFNINFVYPNSYYTPDGLNKIKSPITFVLDSNVFIFELNDVCPLKTLRDRVRGDPNFYASKEYLLPIDTSENIMKSYCYFKANNNIA